MSISLSSLIMMFCEVMAVPLAKQIFSDNYGTATSYVHEFAIVYFSRFKEE